MKFDAARFAYLMFQQLIRLRDPLKKKRQRRNYLSRHRFEIAMHKQLLRMAFPNEAKANDRKRTSPGHPNYRNRRIYLRKCNREYSARNPEKIMANTLRYQARKRAARNGRREPVIAVYRRAKELRQWFDVVVDHIIPFTKGGKDCSDNLQIIYRRDNDRKGSRLDYIPSVIFS